MSERNWDELLEDIIDKIDAEIEFRKLVKHNRLQENISLSELAKEVDVPEDTLWAYEEGEEVDSKSFLKITLRFLEREKESMYSEELKEQFQFIILLCKLALYGTEEQIEGFIDFAVSFCENQEESSNEQ